jgi:kynurenine aminotransferase
LVFDNKEHVRIATLPRMWDRTVTVGSAGSEFSFCLPGSSFSPFSLESFAATGWRVGWLIGPSSIINPTLAASTRIVFCTNSPLQEAVAAGLEQAAEHRFFETQLREYQERRDLFVTAFDRLGVKYSLPEGTYFVLMVCHKCPDRDQLYSYSPSQDSSSVKFPDDYPFPETVLGRGRDFRCIFNAVLG